MTETQDVDWPARFRAAADTAEGAGSFRLSRELRKFADRLDREPAHVVEAIAPVHAVETIETMMRVLLDGEEPRT